METSIDYEISSEKYNVKEFVDKFKDNFQPTLVKVQDGYVENFCEHGQENVCLITEIKHHKLVTLKCQSGQHVNLPVTNPLSFRIVTDNEPSCNQYTISELFEMSADFVTPCILCKDFTLRDKARPACADKMKVVRTFVEQFLYGHYVTGEKDCITFYTHSPVKFKLITGMKGGSLKDHVQQLVNRTEHKVNDIGTDNKGLVVCHEGLQRDSDYEYMNSWMIHKDHAKLSTWRQRKCTPPSASDDKCDSQPLDKELHPPAQQICSAVQQCIPTKKRCPNYVNILTGIETTHMYANVPSANDAALPQIPSNSCQSFIPTTRREDNQKMRKSKISIHLQGPNMKVVLVPHTYVHMGQPLHSNLHRQTSSSDEKFEIYDTDFEEKYHRELYEKGCSLMRTLNKLNKAKHQSNSVFKCPSCKKGSNHSRLYKNIKQTVQNMEAVFGSQSCSLVSYDMSESSDSDDVFYDENDPKAIDFEDYSRINNIQQSTTIGADNDIYKAKNGKAKYMSMKRLIISQDYLNSNSQNKEYNCTKSQYSTVCTNEKCLTKGPNIKRSVSDVPRRFNKTLPVGTTEGKNISYNTIYVDEYNKLEKQLEVSTITLACKGKRHISTIRIPENATTTIDDDSTTDSAVRQTEHKVHNRKFSEASAFVSDIQENYTMSEKKSTEKSKTLYRRSKPKHRSKSDDDLLYSNSKTRDVGDRKCKVFNEDKTTLGLQILKELDQSQRATDESSMVAINKEIGSAKKAEQAVKEKRRKFFFWKKNKTC